MVDHNVGCLTCFQPSDLIFQTAESIKDALRKHFWFTEDYLKQAVMCQSCWDQVINFHRFYVSVEELHHHQISYGNDVLPECSSIKVDVAIENQENSSDKEHELKVAKDADEDIGADEPLTEPLMNENSDQDVAKRKRFKEFISEDDCIKKHGKYPCEQCGHECDTFSDLKEHALSCLCHRDNHQNLSLGADDCEVLPESSHGRTLDEQNKNLRVMLTDCLTEGMLECPVKTVTINKDQSTSTIVVKEEHVIEDSNEEIDQLHQDKSESDNSQDDMEQDQNDSESTVAKQKSKNKTKRHLLPDDFIRKHVKYICEECGQESLTFKHFMDHGLEIHGNHLAFVPCCGKKFRRKHLLFQHVQTLNNPNMFRCEECKSSFQSKQYYRQHIRHIHGGKRYNCHLCGKSYASKYILQRHREDHLGEVNLKWKCPHCERIFLNRQTIEYHVKRYHLDAPDFCCDICPQKFRIESWLVEHKLKHKELQCLLCPQRFPYGKSLRAHVAELHPGANLPMMCTLCRDVLPTKVALDAHRVQEHKRRSMLADDSNFMMTDQLEDSSIDDEEEQVVEEQTVENVKAKTELENSEDEMEKQDDADLDVKRHQNGILLCDQVLERPSRDALSDWPHENQHSELSQDQLVSIIVKSETKIGDDNCLEEALPECSYDRSVGTERMETTRNDGVSEHYSVAEEGPDPDELTISKQQAEDLIKNHVQFTCEHCGEESQSYFRFKRHAKHVHNAASVVRCCGKKFPRKSLLLEHVQLINNPDFFRCKGCFNRYASHQSLRNHIKKCTYTIETCTVKCDRCQKSFHDEDAYMHHLKDPVGLGDTIGKCEHCDAVFTNCVKQDRHIRTMHPDAAHTICDICCVGFYVKEWYNEHTLGHERDDKLAGMFKCGLCPECFTDKAQRKLHVKDHAGWEQDNWVQHFASVPQYICSVCSKVFRTDFLLQQHKFKHGKPALQ